MAESLCPLANCRYRSLRPSGYEEEKRAEFLGALADVRDSAILQCAGNKKYKDLAKDNRERIAADLRVRGQRPVKLNRHSSQQSLKVA